MMLRAACVVVAVAGLFACGGSSSETPPPLEPSAAERELPEPQQSPSTGSELDSTSEDAESSADAASGQTAQEAPATWGVSPRGANDGG